jgi:hypothetical protein
VFITHLQTSVRNNLLDKEVQNLILNDLTGLLGTGFSSESILADIQALENAEPDDLREWRIGEAMAEVILEEISNVDFTGMSFEIQEILKGTRQAQIW